jgi:hypothetical protein
MHKLGYELIQLRCVAGAMLTTSCVAMPSVHRLLSTKKVREFISPRKVFFLTLLTLALVTQQPARLSCTAGAFYVIANREHSFDTAKKNIFDTCLNALNE